jgi:hypothetical protein
MVLFKKNTTENLCYLLWREEVNREEWVSQMATWARCSPRRALSLLIDGTLQSAEQENIAAEVKNVTAEEIQYVRLVERDSVDIRRENVCYLTDTRQHRVKMKDVADSIGVKNFTLTRWKNEEQMPSPSNLRELCRFYGLSRDVDPESDPIFLLPLPIGDTRRREWLYDRIKDLESTTLQDLFPALERLLREP